MDKIKKLTRVVLSQQGKILQKEEMMKVLGGGSAFCICYGNSGYGVETSNCSNCPSICSNSGGVQNCNTIG